MSDDGLIFKDLDGVEYKVRHGYEISQAEMLQLHAHHTALVELLKDPAVRVGQHPARDAHLHACLCALIIDLPLERLQAIPLEAKLGFFEWWGANTIGKRAHNLEGQPLQQVISA